MTTSARLDFRRPAGLSRALLALALTALCSAAVQAKPAPPAVPQGFYPAFINQFDLTSSNSQGSTGVALDGRGNVVVTGYDFENDGATRFFYTAKYDALDGHLDWNTTFAAAGDAVANSVAVDSQGNVYVGGGAILSNGGNELYYLIKYSGTDGSTLWSQSYDGTAGGENEIRKVIVDSNDNVIATGISFDTGEGLDMTTVKYNSSGALQWVQPFDYDHQDDIPSGLACDGTGNVFVAGSCTDASQNQVFVTAAYTAAGALSWTGTYQSPAAGDSGATYGATAVAVDSHGNPITTGHYTDASFPANDGFYTVKYSGSSGASGTTGIVIWSTVLTSTGIVESSDGGAKSIAIDGDDNVLVTGPLSNGVDAINTVKYSGTDGSQLWAISDTGTGGGPAHSVQVTTDGGNNAIVVGDAYDATLTVQDLYIAKYSQADGHLIWSDTFAGSFSQDAGAGDNFGVGVATDANGNIVATGIAARNQPGATGTNSTTGIGIQGFVTIKNDRFLLETNDALPATGGLNSNPVIFSVDPPALCDATGFTGLVEGESGKTKLQAILTEDTGGGILLPAVQKAAAAGGGGTYSLFSDPVVAPDGAYGFTAKLTGVPKSAASGAWSDMSGALSLVLQQGSPVPGVAGANVEEIESLSMRDNQLLALLKVSGPAATSSLLLGLGSGGNGTALVRSGQGIVLGADSTTVKTITALSPTVLSPGDGRWQGDASSVVNLVGANKATAICSVTPGGVLTPLLYSGEGASNVVNGATWASFGLPCTDPTGVNYATTGSLAGSVTKASDKVLVTSTGGGLFSLALQSGGTPTDPNLAGTTFAGFSDPIINSSGELADIVTLAGSGVTKANNQALLYGLPSSGLTSIARLGRAVTDSAGNPDTPVYASFTDFVLASGLEPAPIFVAKISGEGVTSKTNMGLWAYGTDGAIRRLLRTGDTLGTRTVSSFTILKTPSKTFSAARNFNATAQVAAMVVFTDHTEALVDFGIP